ncbi:MAG: hypothetical protein JNN05_11825 [Candidatus Omnitrophica bacterium]|nr:hypothetical protein [Candidatus Omnitrophota bacterium]
MDLINRLVSNRALGALVIVAFTLFAYSFMLQAPFRSMDDTTSIVENKDLRDFKSIPKVWTSAFFGDQSYYRPLVTMSFMLEYAIYGLNSFWFNLDNLILHILNTLCVFVLFARLWSDKPLALLTALLFAIHPVQWEAICNVAGRPILLSALCVFCSFLLFMEFDTRRHLLWLMGSLAGFIIGIFCKESTVIFPVVLGMYLFYVSKSDRKPWMALLPFFMVIFGYFELRRQLGITQVFAWGSLDASVLGFLSFVRGCITYLRLYVFPVDLYFDRSRAVFGSFVDPQLLGTILFWIAAISAVWAFRAKINSKVLFCMLWFLLEFAPVCQIVTSLGVQPGYISLAEHFLYVPTAAMAAILVWAARGVQEINRQRKWCSPAIAQVAVAGIGVFLYLTTIQQAVYASSELSMLKRSVTFQPNNSRVLYSIGMNYVNRGMFEVAHTYFQQAVRVDPWNVRAKIALGKVLCDQGQYEDCLDVYGAIRNPGPFAAILEENVRLTHKIIEQKRGAVKQ